MFVTDRVRGHSSESVPLYPCSEGSPLCPQERHCAPRHKASKRSGKVARTPLVLGGVMFVGSYAWRNLISDLSVMNLK
jgi:hypothetical protein